MVCARYLYFIKLQKAVVFLDCDRCFVFENLDYNKIINLSLAARTMPDFSPYGYQVTGSSGMVRANV